MTATVETSGDGAESSYPVFADRVLACLKAPGGSDAEGLVQGDRQLICPTTGEAFAYSEEVPSLFAPSPGEGAEVTDKIKTFYEENPFPTYEGVEEFGELVNKGMQNRFSADLLEAIGFNKLILECGCGTGQLSPLFTAEQQSRAGHRHVSREPPTCDRAQDAKSAGTKRLCSDEHLQSCAEGRRFRCRYLARRSASYF